MTIKAIAYIGNTPVTRADLVKLSSMAKLAKRYSALHEELSDGCNYVLFDMHNENSSVNHLARWIEQNTDEAVACLKKVFQ